MSLYYFILFILWTFFWSFSTVLTSRWRDKKPGIMTGRSECPKCWHTLRPTELVPIFSWILQWGKCASCKGKISILYPLSEIMMWLLFVWSGYLSFGFWYTWEDFMWWVFLFWTFVTWVYIIYDIRYMEIPDEIVIPWILFTCGLLIYHSITWGSNLWYDTSSYLSSSHLVIDHVSAAVLVYSFFFLQILIPWTIFLIKNKDYANTIKLFFSYFTFPIIMILGLFCKQKPENTDTLELPAWIWWWDLRLAWFVWLTLGGIHSLAAIFFAYLVGSIVGLVMIWVSYLRGTGRSHEIAFWPFIWIWWILSLSYYSEILDYLDTLYM
jgi:prepilin signal peptidase PulO-like enzyme (type II secretory pathway)